MSAALSATAFCALFVVLLLFAPLLLEVLERRLLVLVEPPTTEDAGRG